MTMNGPSTPTPGRPRSDVDAAVFEATLQTVHDLGYAGATMDKIAAAAGVAKTTIYRRWPSKGALVAECLVHTFGPLPLATTADTAVAPAVIQWIAEKISEPGVGGAFAGVYSDAITDPALRDILRQRLQDPYRRALEETLNEPPDRVLFFVDLVVGTLLHRLGMTGAPMAPADVDLLIDLVHRALR